LPNVQDEPRLWLARLLRSRRRDGHGRWLWRLVGLLHSSRRNENLHSTIPLDRASFSKGRNFHFPRASRTASPKSLTVACSILMLRTIPWLSILKYATTVPGKFARMSSKSYFGRGMSTG